MKYMRFLSMAIAIIMLLTSASFAEELGEMDLYAPEIYAAAETDWTPDFEEGRGLGWVIVDGRYPQTGRLFPAGSFGHCGNTGTSFFMDRRSGLYVILLTNATRFSYMRRNYRSCDYAETMRMREAVHEAIREDIGND